MKKIAILINSFNRLELLKGCLSALETWIFNISNDFSIQVYIFDAGSSDGSLEFLREKVVSNTAFHLLTPSPGQDSSIAGGFNAAAATAFSGAIDITHLLLYETDNAIYSADSVKSALSILDLKSDLAACGFTVRYHSGSQAGAGMQHPTLREFLAGKKLSHLLRLDQIPYRWQMHDRIKFSYVDVVFTSPLLVKAEAWHSTGGMDSIDFPFSDCDVDWAKRLSLLGFKMGVVETSDVVHDNQAALSEWSHRRAIDFHHARLKYFRKYRPTSIFLIWPILLLFRHLIELIAIRLFVKDQQKYGRLFGQYSTLIRTCLFDYSR
jgi:GT2 family glycosyltransferase